MHQSKTKRGGLLLLLLLALSLAGPRLAGQALAQSDSGTPAALGTGFDLSRWVVAGGGGASAQASDGYTLMGTLGQPDAGFVQSGGGFTLAGGFWGSGEAAARYDVYLPLILRNF